MQHHPVFPPSPADPVPQILRDWLQTLRPYFTAPSWEHVLVLVMGAVLAPGKRTVSACLRMTGRAEAKNFSSYHQLLNRARWDTRAMARRLLVMVIDRLVPDGPVVIGMDDTIERRWGRRITARGIYRDPVRSSHGHFVKRGLRWLSFMVLTPVPWAGVVKALPVLTLLAPSERSDHQRGRRHKLLTDWARQGALQLCRWLPGRDIVFVGDSSFAVHELAHALDSRATLISPLRLKRQPVRPSAQARCAHGRAAGAKGARVTEVEDAALEPCHALAKDHRVLLVRPQGKQDARDHLGHRLVVPPRHAAKAGPLGAHQDAEGKRAPQAFFSTDTTLDPAEIIALFVRRWQVEVTFAETRAHLGVETQRQWSDKAINRTTPALLGLYSLVSLWACDLLTPSSVPHAGQHGIERPASPSPTPSARSVSPCGSATFTDTHRQTRNGTESRPTASCVWLKPSASPRDVQSRASVSRLGIS